MPTSLLVLVETVFTPLVHIYIIILIYTYIYTNTGDFGIKISCLAFWLSNYTTFILSSNL